MITAKGDNLVFLLGIPRSGTTLLSVLLNNHPAVRCPPEPWVMLALESIGRTSAHDPCDAPVLQKAFTRFCEPSAAIGFARKFAVAAYNRAIGAGKKILVDKTPRYYLILPYLREMFPSARFIVLWRDPLDIAASMKQTWNFDVPRWLGEGQEHPACIDLIVGLRRIFDFSRSLAADQCRTLRYEDLVRDSRAALSGIFEWLGLPAADADGRFALSGGEFEKSPYGDRKILMTTQPHERSVGKWRESFDAEQATMIASRIGQPLLEAIGYTETGKLCIADRFCESEFRRLEESVAGRRNEYAGVDSYSDLYIEEQRIRRAILNGHANGDHHSNGDFISLFRGLGERASHISEIDAARRSSEADAGNLRNEVRARDEEIERLRGQIESLRKQVESGESERANLGGHVASLENRLADEQERTRALRVEAAEIAAQMTARLVAQEAEAARDLMLRAGEVHVLKTEIEAGQRIHVEMRAAMSSLQDLLRDRVQEAGALLSKLHESTEVQGNLRKEIDAQQAATNRFAAKWERAQRLLTHMQAASSRRMIDLESQLRVVRDELIAERSTSGRLGNQAAGLENQVAGFERKVAGLEKQAVGLGKQLEDAHKESTLAARQHHAALVTKEQAIEVLAKATRELDTRLRMLLTSRFMRFGWKLGFGSVPYWDDPTRDELTGIVETVWKQASPTVSAPDLPADEMDRALQHLVEKGLRPKVVLDIGAAKGYWTRNAAWRWPEAQFFMIDPLTESEESLREICRDVRFQYCLTAVGKEPGEMIMNLTKDFDGSSLLEFPDPNPERQRRVPVATIDQLLEAGKLKLPDLVKIDVQGFEIQVMEGGRRMFETAEVFILEVSLYRFMAECPRVDEIVRYMADREFFLFDVAGLLRRPFENDLGQMDLVFVSARSPLGASTRWS